MQQNRHLDLLTCIEPQSCDRVGCKEDIKATMLNGVSTSIFKTELGCLKTATIKTMYVSASSHAGMG